MMGRHLILDCWGCGERANDSEGARTALRRAIMA